MFRCPMSGEYSSHVTMLEVLSQLVVWMLLEVPFLLCA